MLILCVSSTESMVCIPACVYVEYLCVGGRILFSILSLSNGMILGAMSGGGVGFDIGCAVISMCSIFGTFFFFVLLTNC